MRGCASIRSAMARGAARSASDTSGWNISGREAKCSRAQRLQPITDYFGAGGSIQCPTRPARLDSNGSRWLNEHGCVLGHAGGGLHPLSQGRERGLHSGIIHLIDQRSIALQNQSTSLFKNLSSQRAAAANLECALSRCGRVEPDTQLARP